LRPYLPSLLPARAMTPNAACGKYQPLGMPGDKIVSAIPRTAMPPGLPMRQTLDRRMVSGHLAVNSSKRL
jgi:hypothetical protein